MAIRKLEEVLGEQLFSRDSKQVSLTEFGRRMKPHLEEIMNKMRSAEQAAKELRVLNETPVRLGVMSTIGLSRLAPAIAEFAREAPDCELAVYQGAPGDLEARLACETLDIAVFNAFAGLSPNLRAEPLYAERYQVILPPNHPLLAQSAIPLAALANRPYVDRLLCELRDVVASVSSERGIPLYAKFRSEREDWIEGLVRAGIGFAFMPEYCILDRDTPRRPLIDPEVERTVSVVTAPARPLAPRAATLLDILRRHDWV